MSALDGVLSVAFLCDQQAECKESVICGKECTHTLDIKHAKNFKKIADNKYIEK